MTDNRPRSGDASYEERLAEIAASAAPRLDAATVSRLRDLLAPALHHGADVAPVVPLPVGGALEAPERAA